MNILQNNFSNITEEDRKILKEYFDGFDYRGAGYTFLANYIWRNTHCICWEIVEGYLCMAGADCMIGDPAAIISMPLTKDGWYDVEGLKKCILEVKSRFDSRKINFSIELIPKHMVHFLEEAFHGELHVEHDRDADEYVYLKDKLITLSGRALHKKKNHMNYFLKNFEYEVKPIASDMTDEIMNFVRKFTQHKGYGDAEAESLNMEEEAIMEILEEIERPDVYSVAVYIKGNLEAFAIGELLNEDTAVEHFEKANDDFRGLYQVVTSEFCKSLPDNILYVNREEDMGLENLRAAKEALKPDHMEEKFSACFL